MSLKMSEVPADLATSLKTTQKTTIAAISTDFESLFEGQLCVGLVEEEDQIKKKSI